MSSNISFSGDIFSSSVNDLHEILASTSFLCNISLFICNKDSISSLCFLDNGKSSSFFVYLNVFVYLL